MMLKTLQTSDARAVIRSSVAAMLTGFGLMLTASAFATETPVPAGTNVEAIKANVETWLKGKYKVVSVLGTPMPGIVEVRLGNDLIYADVTGRYVFVEGQMIDLKSGENLTESRIEDIQTIKWSDLPLNLALKSVRGNGKRQVAVFEDPNCGYCRQFRRQLLSMNDLTVYTFVYPILAPDSEAKARAVWCQKDRLKAWDDWMLEGKTPPSANCDNPLSKVVELGKRLGVSGTPTVFFVNGKRTTGAVPVAKLDKMLADASAAAK